MYNIIVQAGVSGKCIYNANEFETSTPKHAIKTTVKAAVATVYTLQLSRVINPVDTVIVHVVFENLGRFTAERIEIFAASIRIDEDCYPVRAGFVRRVGVADQ